MYAMVQFHTDTYDENKKGYCYEIPTNLENEVMVNDIVLVDMRNTKVRAVVGQILNDRPDDAKGIMLKSIIAVDEHQSNNSFIVLRNNFAKAFPCFY